MTAEIARRQAKVELEVTRAAFQTEVQLLASKILKRPVILRLTPHEQNQLLNLRVWSIRREVKLEYVLRVLLEFWPRVLKGVKPKNQGLGIRIATLCGQKSREVLDEAIVRDYPEQENRSEARASLEVAVASSEEVSGASGLYMMQDPGKFIRAYKARLGRAQKAVEDLRAQLQGKPFRGNPYK